VPLPLPLVGAVPNHGILMVSGFLGSVISLERAVAIERPWAYAAPLLTALGGAALVIGGPYRIGATMILIGSIVFVASSVVIIWRRNNAATWMMALAALAWVLGNLRWLSGAPVPAIVFLWASFIVVTVSAERVELSRILSPSRGSVAVLIGACAVSIAAAAWGSRGWSARSVGASWIAIAIWLARFDIARHNYSRPGLPRFMAVAIALGTVWLAMAGGTVVIRGEVAGSLWYDAILHSLFLGFAFSMIFAHAPVIIPSIAGVPLAFSRAFYVPLVALSASLAGRIVSDALVAATTREVFGAANALALLSFFVVVGWAIRRGIANAAHATEDSSLAVR